MAQFSFNLNPETLARARLHYGQAFSEVSESGEYTAVWEAHRPSMAGLDQYRATYALPFLARLQLENPHNWNIAAGKGAYPTTNLMEELAYLLSDYRKFHGENNLFIPIIKGVSQYIDGFEHQAFMEFAKVSGEEHLYDIIKDDFSGAASARPLLSARGIRAFEGQAGFPEIIVHSQSAQLEPSLISISFDAYYFRAFSPDWFLVAQNLRQHSIGCHFHLIARCESEIRLLDTISAWAKENDISYILTYEVTRPLDRAYFTVRRFFAAKVVTKVAPKSSLLILDADLSVEDPGKIASLFGLNNGISVAFSSGPWHGYLPWRRMSGGVVLIPSDEGTRRYLDLVTNFVEYFWLSNADRHWWADQMALECARLLSLKIWPQINFNDLGSSIWNTFFASEDYKVELLTKLPEVRDAVARGVHWHTALRRLQLNA